MKLNALFHTDCPSCGAPVEVHSATAVSVVCAYCKSLLLYRDNTLTDTGHDSALLTDFSPLQIGTGGQIGNLHFAVAGRLQVQYDAGVWNEWYLLFDDGGTGWLSEAGDLYVLLRPAASPADAPDFGKIRAGQSTLDYQDKRFVAADVRDITLRRVAAEGELPFTLADKMHNRVSDFRSEAYFLTLDYASQPPEAFLGYGVELQALKLQNTRSDAQIIASAGKLKGAREAQSCPHCGSPVEWIAGITPSIVCPSCASTLDASGDKAVLLEAGQTRDQQQAFFSLKIGMQATIHDKPYTLIGAVYKEELGEDGAPWAEYLLYNPQAGFLWLVETDDGQWSLARTMNRWPRLDRNNAPRGCRLLYDYQSRVRFAAGAFYWQIRRGDHTFHRDYRQGKEKISAEITDAEMSWSKSREVSRTEVNKWFGLSPATLHRGQAHDNRTLSYVMIALYLFFNIPAWLAMKTSALGSSLVVSLIIIAILHHLGKIPRP